MFINKFFLYKEIKLFFNNLANYEFMKQNIFFLHSYLKKNI